MPTECSPTLFEFAPVEGRAVVAAFDGGAITSDAGALLLGATDRAIRLVDRFAACFIDARCAELIEHEVSTTGGQRVFGIALGYEDLNDHDELRHDPVMAVLAGKLAAKRSDCAPLAGKSTLNRLELSRPEATRYHKISHDPAAIETLFVDLFLEAHRRAAGADHPRPGRHGRSAARPAGRPVLPRLLRLLLLSAALRLLRPSSAGGQAAAVEHRRRGWRDGGGGADRRRRSAAAGRRRASCCAAIPASPARR